MNRSKALSRAKRMKIDNRIDLIREKGTATMQAGLKAVFGDNLYKPKRPEMWEKGLKKGVLMVAYILEREENGHEDKGKVEKKEKEGKVSLSDYGGDT